MKIMFDYLRMLFFFWNHLPGLDFFHLEFLCQELDDEHREQGQDRKYRHADHHAGIHPLQGVDMYQVQDRVANHMGNPGRPQAVGLEEHVPPNQPDQ